MENLDWCIQHASSTDPSENLGRCINHATAGAQCVDKFQVKVNTFSKLLFVRHHIYASLLDSM